MFDSKELSDALRQLSHSIQELELELVLGEVFFAYPALQSYVILPRVGDEMGTLTIATTSSGASTRKSGVRGGDHYMPGTSVLLARTKVPTGIKLQNFSDVYIGFIVGKAPPRPLDSIEGYPLNTINNPDLDYFKQMLTDAYTSSDEVPDASIDVSFGIPTDTFAGDFSKVGSLLNFISIGAIHSTLGASPGARIDCFGFYDKVRLTAQAFEQYGDGCESGYYPDKDSIAFYTQQAYTQSEGLGAIGVPPFVVDDDGALQPTAADAQLPIFRQRELAGKIAEGDWETFTDPEISRGASTETTVQTVAQRGRLSIRKYYDGRYEVRSNNQINLVKSAYIPVPALYKKQDKAAFALADLQGQSYESQHSADFKGFYDVFGAAIENEEFEWDTENYYNARIRARHEYWALHSKADINETYSGIDIVNEPKTLAELSATKSQYDEPPYAELANPSTGGTDRVYALESCIRQMPDGTIIIADGHGSELRMYRGKVTLTSAADMEIRPGRDLVEMTPRNRILNTGKDLYIQSAEEGVHVKAERDLNILSGNSGQGVMTIESRATADDVTEEDARALRKGIVIKSPSVLGIRAQHSYFGITEANPSTQGGFKRSGSGSITIDSCSGILGLMGMSAYLQFDSSITANADDAVLALEGARLGLFARQVHMGTGYLLVNRPDVGSMQLSQLAIDGIQTIQADIGTSRPLISFGGPLSVDGDLYIAKSVIANLVGAVSGYFNNAASESGVKGANRAPSINVPEVETDKFGHASEAFEEGASPEVTGLDDEKLHYALFKYPGKKLLKTEEWKILATKWQLMLNNGGMGETWVEKPVTDADNNKTYIYPGAEYWNGGSSPYLLGLAGEKPLSEYIINKR